MNTKTAIKTVTAKNVLLAAAAFSTVLTMSAAPMAAKAADKEKCFGVAVAGKNDCATATSSCAGTSKVDAQRDAFIALPKGLCERIAGGSLQPKKS